MPYKENESELLDSLRCQVRLLKSALDALPLSLNIKDASGRYRFINSHQARNAGKPAQEILGQEVGIVGGQIWREVVRERDLRVLATGEPIGPYRDDFEALFDLDGHWLTFKAPFSVNDGCDLDHVVTLSFDVTQYVETENRLRHAAYTDPLTGLPNRSWFENEINQFADPEQQCKSSPNWLIVLDIDHFKAVNDNFGHHVGDSVLRETGVRLRQSIRSCDTAIRHGGEEFVVLVAEATEEEVKEIAERIRVAFDRKPMFKVETAPTITVSIGAASIRRDNFGETFKCADRALYDAKKEGRNRVVVAH